MDIAALAGLAGEAAPQKYVELPPVEPWRVVHVDGDFLAYQMSGSSHCSPGEARNNLLSRLEQAKFRSGASQVVVHLTAAHSTKGDRFHASTILPYQGQRTSGRKPDNWDYLRGMLETYTGPAFTVKTWDTREADDGMCLVGTAFAKQGKLMGLYYKDKDMQMFPGQHIDWDTFAITEVPYGTYEIVSGGKTYGHKWFWIQMLIGDTADHIPGIKGCGKVTAEALLAGTTCNDEARPIVLGAYYQHYGADYLDAFVEQATLLWMRNDSAADLLNFLQLGFGPLVTEAAQRMYVRVQQSKDNIAALLEGQCVN